MATSYQKKNRSTRSSTKKMGLFFLIVIFCSSTVKSQSFLGQTNSVHFTKNNYRAGTQNWKIVQDNQGRIYVANNEGVLVYDGNSWALFPLPNHTIVRSIQFGNDGRLYAGGQDEFGYFEPNSRGTLVFKSLINLIDSSDRDFADVWNVETGGNGVFFRSNTRLFHFHDNKLTVYRTWSQWEFLGRHQNQVIVQDNLKGILLFKNGAWRTLIDGKKLPVGIKITSTCNYKNATLVTTLNNGMYIISDTILSPFLISPSGINNRQFFTSVQPLENHELLVGTYDNGIYHIDSNGHVIQTFTKDKGLLVNDVKCIFSDKRHNIWIGLDNGITFLGWNDAVKRISPAIFNRAPGYGCTLYANKLYFALANGIYTLPFQQNPDISSYSSQPNKMASDLSWNVSNLGNHLFTGREDGLYEIINDKLVAIDKKTGYWLAEPLSKPDEKLLFAAGNYQGLSFFKEDNGSFVSDGNFTLLNASSRFLAYDSLIQVIWVSHPYRGVYKVSLSKQTVTLLTSKNGLPSNLDNHIFKVNNKILVATTKGIFIYNYKSERFELSQEYDQIFKGMSLRYLKDDKYGNLWFVNEKNLGVVDHITKTIVHIPEVSGRILSGFENVFPIDSNNIIVGGDEGFFHINYKKYTQGSRIPEVYISRVVLKEKSDSLLFGGLEWSKNATIPSAGKLNYKLNSFHFEFASSSFDLYSNTQYSYQLENFDLEWSEWSNTTYKDYTNIPPGSYIFKVKARNALGQESVYAVYKFNISPAWYASNLAWIIYVIAGMSLLYLFWKQRENKLKLKQEKKLVEERKRFEREQQQRESLHQLELEKAEKEMIRIKNEKLESEIEFKNAQLAATAMNLVQKKEFLVKFKDELNRLKLPANSGTVETSEINKLLRSISEQVNAGDEWEQFSLLFNKLHRDFLITLKERYPGITAHELKLCAYLRMNLSSKEIAHLMSISVRGVEIGRYRLRKKLEIPPKEDLFQFLFNIGGKE